MIDRFLSREFRRIVPDPASFPAGEDLARESVREDPELISEELADIYARQGLYAKAKEIYARLSLLYPEKSVYFAEIIDKALSADYCRAGHEKVRKVNGKKITNV